MAERPDISHDLDVQLAALGLLLDGAVEALDLGHLEQGRLAAEAARWELRRLRDQLGAPPGLVDPGEEIA